MPRPILSRRRLLLVPPALLLAAAAPDRVGLQPGATPVAVTDDRACAATFTLRIEGATAPLAFPGLRARRLPNLPIAERELLVVTFGADLPGIAEQDLVAMAGWDGSRFRVLGLETLNWRKPAVAGDYDAFFQMRPASCPDRQHVMLDCTARMARPVVRPFHRKWLDQLAWREGAPLADSLPRPAQAGSWQAEMNRVRAEVTAFLSTPRTSLTLDDVAATGILRQFDCMADT